MNTLQKLTDKWQLKSPALIAKTKGAELYKVEYKETSAVLKIWSDNSQAQEMKAATSLHYLQEKSVVSVFQSDDQGLLMEFLEGPSLKSLVFKNQDDLATEIMCSVVQSLHSFTGEAPEGIPDLRQHFQSLFIRARLDENPLIAEGARCVEKLLISEKNKKLLHGDIHHENILYSTVKGWRAIDLKFLYGEATYDYANIFYNPLDLPNVTDKLNSRLEVILKNSSLDRDRLLIFAFAYGCLSAAWSLEDREDPDHALRLAENIRKMLK